MGDSVADGTLLTPVDTAWLHMEDPTNLMMVTGIYVFDEPIDFARLKDTVRVRMVERFPRLSHRVKQSGTTARWVKDPTFDLDAHIHRIALPRPCDDGALRDTVSDLMSMPLDFSKPLWQIHLVENYGGGAVVLIRLHHCIGDGIALVHVLLTSTDTTADAPWPKSAPKALHEKHVGSRITSLFEGVQRLAVTTRKAADTLATQTVESLLHPSHVLEVGQTAMDAAGVLAKMILRPADPKTVLKGTLGVAKRAAWSRKVPVADVKAISRRIGGTVNDVLLTAVSGALRRYLLFRGEKPDGKDINAMVPVNLRPPAEADQLGNRFGLIYLSLPVGERDPAERLHLVKKRMDAIKKTPEPFVAFQILSALGLAPAEVASFVVDMFGSKSTAVMTNVVGPKQPVYFAGHRLADMMFWVPQSGRMGLGVSIFSYDGHVVVGVATDAGLVPDPERIAAFFEEELESLGASRFPILDEARAAAPETRKKPWRKTPPATSSATPSPRSRTAAGKRPAARRKASKR
ncbi:MAG: wax ester/triacylglycerol synthase family O-acyltransferase [Holophagales bacterium]|nr:wax ester/triacylglycerol synthase family O-acyltransferase [Holophagales bacterium]MBK9965336.1 wax ester/triacylglycerol synthase family O-acyltransferase [Holophagales bacterium]